jgi:hypothetical protein
MSFRAIATLRVPQDPVAFVALGDFSAFGYEMTRLQMWKLIDSHSLGDRRFNSGQLLRASLILLGLFDRLL